MLSAVEDGPGDTAGVLSLQEEGLGLAALESEDLAVATDVEATLQHNTVSLRNVHDVLTQCPQVHDILFQDQKRCIKTLGGPPVLEIGIANRASRENGVQHTLPG